jgi:dCMP deaminase
MRPSFDEIFLDLAVSLARRSTCRRLQVGCVITSVDHRQVFAVGYNGNATGEANDCDRHGEEAVGNCGCIHSEANAAVNCVAPRRERKFVYCTHLPCVACTKLLINLGGVQLVVFKDWYRKTDSLDLLGRNGIQTLHMQKTDRDQLEENLRVTQERCTELLEEARRLRGDGA